MFTGIIGEVGRVQTCHETKGGDTRFDIEGPRTVEGLKVGDSVACNGICLTVVSLDRAAFSVTASQTTRTMTTCGQWCEGTPVNLERSLRVGDSLDGHFVFGHIDGVATAAQIDTVGGSLQVLFTLDPALSPCIAARGSVAVDGVSLTVTTVTRDHFGVTIILHTRQETGFSCLKAGDRVNIELDMLARYAARLKDVESTPGEKVRDTAKG